MDYLNLFLRSNICQSEGSESEKERERESDTNSEWERERDKTLKTINCRQKD